MAARRFRVAYVERPAHEAFLRTAAAHPALELVRIPADAPAADALAALRSCQGYYVSSSRQELPARLHLDAALLERLPGLLMAASYGAGFDTVDGPACTAAGVAAVNQAGGNAQGVAEHALGMILALLKRIPEAQSAMRAGAVTDRDALMGRELSGRTVGLVGLGAVGATLAGMLRAFGCRVLAVDPALDAAACAARGAEKAELDAVLGAADVVSLHCPLEPATRHLFDAARFARMRPGAVFVSTARGGVHDEAALLDALRSGHVAGAGLDVWEDEPPPADHPLLGHPAVLASPHTAGVTGESRARIGVMAAEAFAEAAAGRMPPRVVNPGALPRFAERLRGFLDGPLVDDA